MILLQIPNYETLYALVHASPNIYRVYAANRQRFFTQTILNGLLDRGIETVPASLLRVALIDGSPNFLNADIKRALTALFHQLLNQDGPVILGIKDCKILQCFGEVIRYDRVSEVGTWARHCLSPGKDRSMGGWRNVYYYMVVLGKEYNRPVDDMKREMLDRRREV